MSRLVSERIKQRQIEVAQRAAARPMDDVITQYEVELKEQANLLAAKPKAKPKKSK
jgi:hypothetical protein